MSFDDNDDQGLSESETEEELEVLNNFFQLSLSQSVTFNSSALYLSYSSGMDSMKPRTPSNSSSSDRCVNITLTTSF